MFLRRRGRRSVRLGVRDHHLADGVEARGRAAEARAPSVLPRPEAATRGRASRNASRSTSGSNGRAWLELSNHIGWFCMEASAAQEPAAENPIGCSGAQRFRVGREAAAGFIGFGLQARAGAGNFRLGLGARRRPESRRARRAPSAAFRPSAGKSRRAPRTSCASNSAVAARASAAERSASSRAERMARSRSSMTRCSGLNSSRFSTPSATARKR